MSSNSELNPLGNGPVPQAREVPVAILKVPKAWTRLVGAAVTLLFLVVAVVSFMVHMGWRTAQRNVDRITELKERLAVVEARLGVTPTPTPEENPNNVKP